MLQVARTLLDPVDGFLRKASYLIHDRDPLYTKAWTALLKSGGVKCVRIPAQSPNCSPHAERFVKTIRTECLDQFVILGERHLPPAAVCGWAGREWCQLQLRSAASYGGACFPDSCSSARQGAGVLAS